jgi:type I restriction enzyme M protein
MASKRVGNQGRAELFWLKDKSLEDSEDLPPPDELAQEIADDLQTAWEQFASIAEKVKG